MKVGIVTDELGTGCGIGRYTYELINGLESSGFDVEKISLKRGTIRYGDVFNHLYALPHLVFKNRFRCDIFHATSPITGLAFPFIRKKVKIVTYHDLFSLLCRDCRGGFHVRATARHFLRVGKFSDRVITISSQTKEELVRHLGFREEKISVINLGVDERFRPLNEEKNRDEFIVGYLGDLTRRKRIDFIIRSIMELDHLHPNFKIKLHIYGVGTDYPRLKAMVDDLKLNDLIEFRGFAPEKDLVKIYNSFDIFALPSEWEGFGIPILEAQRCGVPVIIRSDAHIPNETSKCCLKAKSELDMADMIYEFINNDSRSMEFIRRGIDHSSKFTWKRTIEDTVNIYNDLLS